MWNKVIKWNYKQLFDTCDVISIKIAKLLCLVPIKGTKLLKCVWTADLIQNTGDFKWRPVLESHSAKTCKQREVGNHRMVDKGGIMCGCRGIKDDRACGFGAGGWRGVDRA